MYTCSYDVSVRVKKSGVTGYLRHLYRDVYADENYNHSNKNIDVKLTKNNSSLIYDDKLHALRHPKDPNDLKKSLLNDIEDFKEKTGKTIRKDAVYLRPVMMELGNGFYRDHPNGFNGKNDEIRYMYQWACNTWGAENVRGMVTHKDEVHGHKGHEGEINPHVVFLISPIRKKNGKLSMDQKNIINGKSHLSKLHQSFRSFMRDKGIDVQMENQESSHPHYNDDEYKQIQDLKRKCEEEKEKWEKLNQVTEEKIDELFKEYEKKLDAEVAAKMKNNMKRDYKAIIAKVTQKGENIGSSRDETLVEDDRAL